MKNGLGNILGDFFTNASDHPGEFVKRWTPAFVWDTNKPVQSQGDQIGRIFAYWAIVFFGAFLKITEVAQIFVLLFTKLQVMY
jgi:hypothetical protein